MRHQQIVRIIAFNRICHGPQAVEEKLLGSFYSMTEHVGGTCALAHWPDWDSLAAALQSDPLPAQCYLPSRSIRTGIWRLYLLCSRSVLYPPKCSLHYSSSPHPIPSPLLLQDSNGLLSAIFQERNLSHKRCSTFKVKMPLQSGALREYFKRLWVLGWSIPHEWN